MSSSLHSPFISGLLPVTRTRESRNSNDDLDPIKGSRPTSFSMVKDKSCFCDLLAIHDGRSEGWSAASILSLASSVRQKRTVLKITGVRCSSLTEAQSLCCNWIFAPLYMKQTIPRQASHYHLAMPNTSARVNRPSIFTCIMVSRRLPSIPCSY